MENYENKVSENTSQDIAPAAGPTVVKTGVGKLWCFDWMRSIIFAICAVMFILAFFVRIVNVDGDSMNMTLLDELYNYPYCWSNRRCDVDICHVRDEGQNF